MTTLRTRAARTTAAPTRVKLHDVAKLAGVSAQTVSRVVRGTAGVREETRQKVTKAIEQLQYRPNLAARSLSARRIGSVHVVVATTLYHGTTRGFIAICEALAEQGLATSTSVARDEEDPFKVVPVTADAVIVLGGTHRNHPWLAPLAARVPVAYVGRVDDLPDGVSGVMIDQCAGARMAVEHLAVRGCRRLAHLAGPQDWLDAQQRLEGFEAAARAHGLPYEVHEAGTWDAVDGLRLGPSVGADVDGVFAANDHLALGFLSHCGEVGRRVPDDVAVVGVDNTSGSDAYPPPLTTIAQHFPTMGKLAVARVSAMLDGAPAEHTLLPPELVVRASA